MSEEQVEGCRNEAFGGYTRTGSEVLCIAFDSQRLDRFPGMLLDLSILFTCDVPMVQVESRS